MGVWGHLGYIWKKLFKSTNYPTENWVTKNLEKNYNFGTQFPYRLWEKFIKSVENGG